MAYNNPITSRLDELRSRNLPSSTAGSESSSGYATPSRYSGSFMPSHSQSVNDTRASLQRRFTTDLSKMPNLTPIGQQPAQIQEAVDVPNTVSRFTFMVIMEDPADTGASVHSSFTCPCIRSVGLIG